MTSQLRTLLGTRHRFHLSNEEVEVPVATATEDATVVMKGPLADVYSDALIKTLDKTAAPDDGSGAPADPTAAPVDTTNLNPSSTDTQDTVEAAVVSEVGNLVLESQAIDAAVVQSLAENVTAEVPADNASYETLYAIDETQVSPTDVKDVTAILADAENPENVTVMVDSVVPEELIPEDEKADVEASKERAVALESMVVAMGGKFVRGFKGYVESRRK